MPTNLERVPVRLRRENNCIIKSWWRDQHSVSYTFLQMWWWIYWDFYGFEALIHVAIYFSMVHRVLLLVCIKLVELDNQACLQKINCWENFWQIILMQSQNLGVNNPNKILRLTNLHQKLWNQKFKYISRIVFLWA